MYLDSQPAAYIDNGDLGRETMVAFCDKAPAGSLTTYQHGVLWVGYDPETLRIRWTEGVRLTAGTDRLQTDGLRAQNVELLGRLVRPLPRILEA